MEPIARETAGSAAARADAQLALGQMLLDAGDGAGAYEAFAAAARGGDARGLNMLGRCHELGWGTRPDPVLAAEFYLRAADLGDAWAMFNLADLHARGRGVAQDDAAAFALYAGAARRGHLKSLNMLGLFHEEGRHVAPDPGAARRFFAAGARGGDCWAQFNLGRMLLPADPEGAAAQFRASLPNGFPAYWAAMAAALADHRDPRLAALGRQAGALALRAPE